MTEPITRRLIHTPSRAKRDCFAYSSEQYDRDGGCTALNRLLCNNKGACPFYKTVDQLAAERRQK